MKPNKAAKPKGSAIKPETVKPDAVADPAQPATFAPVPAEALDQRCQVTAAAHVLHAIRKHARSSMDAEVCGVLIGEETADGTLIEAAIAGQNAAQGGAHVTFTQDTWEHIYAVKDKEYPEKRIVGWYHSHPGFGIFLSRHDTFIHENFFSSPNQVAWVYDPHAEEEGCFGWVDGKLQRLSLVRVVDTDYSRSVTQMDEPDGAESEDRDSDSREDTTTTGKRKGGWRKKLILLFCFALVFLAGLAAGLLLLPMQVVVYSATDGRILQGAEARDVLERAVALEQQRRQQSQSPNGVEATVPKPNPDNAPAKGPDNGSQGARP